MAGRTVGRIEVTVEADTGKLKAQLVKAGKSAGRDMKKAIESEIDKLDAAIDKTTAMEAAHDAARLMRKQMEAELHGIDTTLNVEMDEARERLQRFREFAEANDLALELALGEASVQEVAERLRHMTEEQREVVFRLRIAEDDEARLREEIANIERREELDIEVELAMARAQAEFEKELREMEAEEAEVTFRAEMQMALADATIEAFRREQEADAFDVEMRVALHEATIEMEAWRRREEFKSVGIDLDVAGALEAASAEILAFERTNEVDLEAQVHVNEANLFFQMKELHATAQAGLRDFEANVEVRVDRASKAKADALIENNMRQTGKKSGHAFGSSFLSGDDTKLILIAVAALGDAAAEALTGAVAAATSVVSSAITALGSAAGAATPVVIGLGAALTAIIVGSAGVVDAIGAVNEEFAAAQKEGRAMNLATGDVGAALRGLSPNARDAVTAFADLRDELADVQSSVQDELFRGMGDELRDLGPTIEGIGDALGIAASSANEFGRQLADLAKRTDFVGTMEALDPALDDAFDGATSLVATLEPFLKSAAPAAERLAEMFARGAEALQAWTAAHPTEIAEFLDGGLTSLDRWVELLKSTGDLLATIFAAGQESGDGFVVALNNIIERWDGFLESAEGQEGLADFFDTGRDAMEAMKPVLDGLKEAFDVLISDQSMSNLNQLGEAIGAALPALAELLSLSGQLQLFDAFANVLAVLGPVFDLLNSIPDPMLEIVGMALLLGTATAKATHAIIGLGKAMITMSSTAVKTNAVIAGITLALTAAMVVYEAFANRQNDAKERTEELTTALQNQVDAIVTSGEVAEGASVGMQALNQAITETGDGGEKLLEAFNTINKGAGDATLGVDDAAQTLLNLRGTSEQAQTQLESLATGWGLNAEEAEALASIVNDTDANFKKFSKGSVDPLTMQMTALAEEMGLPVETLYEIANAMEETQDQAENTDMAALAESFLAVARTGTEAEQAMLKDAEAAAAAKNAADDSLVIYEEYTRLLNAAANSASDSADAFTGLTEAEARSRFAAELSTQAIEEQRAAVEERNAAFEASLSAALSAEQGMLRLRDAMVSATQSAEDQKRLEDATRDAADAIAEQAGVSSGTVEGLNLIGDAAKEAADSADALSSAMDTLFGRQIDAGAALDDFWSSLNDINESLKETGEEALPKVGSEMEAWAGHTEAAIGFREAMREGAEQIMAYAEAATNAGDSTSEITANTDAMRESLITTAEQLGLSRSAAERYVEELIGTPDALQTLIEQPGMTAALLNTADLTLAYDAAGNPVITEFTTPGMEAAITDSSTLTGLMNSLPGSVTTTITADRAEQSIGQMETAKTKLEDIDEFEASPMLTANLEDMDRQMDIAERRLEDLDSSTFTPMVDANVQDALRDIDQVQRDLDDLQDKTVNVRVNYTSTGRPPQTMAGGIVTGPQVRSLGERGYAEAVVPLELPLNRVDPSVRAMAELLRGVGNPRMVAASPTKLVNNYLTITPLSADPEAVASSVINRAAALAAG